MTNINIEINSEEGGWESILPDAENIINKAITEALVQSGFMDCAQNVEVSVLLTNDESIRALNRDYRGKDKATNVLSFPLEEFAPGEYDDVSDEIALGDIIFALETIKQEAIDEEKKLEDHLAHLAVHGTLHLIGYDHEIDKEAEEMEALEVEVLGKLGIGNPY